MANILVIDDDIPTAETMVELLKLHGHHAHSAFNGYQAIEIARLRRPNYVLLDLALPGMDGYQIATSLRQELAGTTVVIAISGYGQEEHRRRALAAGCDYYFLKPVNHGALFMLLSGSNPEPDPHVYVCEPAMSVHRERLMRRQLEITNILGLHLRAADRFVRVAQLFRATVQVVLDGRKVSGRSILDLVTLAAGCGSRLELEAEGVDAEAALEALTALVKRGFDEQEAEWRATATASPPGTYNDGTVYRSAVP
jgi:phosphotransferase system HPr (HPr) family protein